MERNDDIRVYETTKDLAIAAAQFILEAAKTAIRKRGRFVFALSGGTTPQTLFSLLAEPSFSEQINWEKTFIFWSDERCVPVDNPENNSGEAKKNFLNKVGIPAANIHPIPVEMPAERSANNYATTIIDFFGEEEPRFDVILLGLGTNGHTASLFPNAKIVFDTRLTSAVSLPELDRITMLPRLINQAHNIVFLVSGNKKSGILQQILFSPFQPEKFPAQLIMPDEPPLYWFTDKEAAILLPEQSKRPKLIV